MKSGGRRTPRDADAPVFFLDRGLGIYDVATALRSAGHLVMPMALVYPNGKDQSVSDDEWIKRASSDWLALTKDTAIMRNHQPALRASTLRVFALNNANLTGPQMAERYLHNLRRIPRRASQPGPYVYIVSSDGIEKRWPVR